MFGIESVTYEIGDEKVTANADEVVMEALLNFQCFLRNAQPDILEIRAKRTLLSEIIRSIEDAKKE
jgi:hypothetical protein